MKRIKPNGEMGIVPMLTCFCHRYPKACAIVGSAVLFVLLILYLLAFFTPGVILYSYGETVFLVRQSDGTFEGRNQYAAYRLEKTAGDEETTIRFFVADTPKEYRVISREDGAHVEIYEDGSLAFEGIAHQSGDSFFLQTESGTLEDGTWDSLGSIEIIVSGDQPDLEDLYPSLTTVYRWAVSDSTQIRGFWPGLLGVAVCTVFLGLDIAFPDLFFRWRHGLFVDGGEPSDLYRTMQKLGRGLAVLFIAAFLVLGLCGKFL